MGAKKTKIKRYEVKATSVIAWVGDFGPGGGYVPSFRLARGMWDRGWTLHYDEGSGKWRLRERPFSSEYDVINDSDGSRWRTALRVATASLIEIELDAAFARQSR